MLFHIAAEDKEWAQHLSESFNGEVGRQTAEQATTTQPIEWRENIYIVQMTSWVVCMVKERLVYPISLNWNTYWVGCYCCKDRNCLVGGLNPSEKY